MKNLDVFKSWGFRIPYAILCAPCLASIMAYISSYNVSNFEGGQGYAAAYSFIISLPLLFIMLLLIKNPAWQLGFGILSAVFLCILGVSYFIH